MTTDAQKRAKAKWKAKNQEQISMTVRRGTKAQWQDLATKAGDSFLGFISKAVMEKAERDGLEVLPLDAFRQPEEEET